MAGIIKKLFSKPQQEITSDNFNEDLEKKEISIENYIRAVEFLAETNDPYPFDNSNIDHAAVVLSTILKYCKEEVHIYDECIDGKVADRVDQMLHKSVVDFYTNTKKTLRLVVRNHIPHNGDFFKTISKYSKEDPERFDIREASAAFQNETQSLFQKDINFAVGDKKSYRMEITDNATDRKAICSFNDHDFALKLLSVFNKHFESCSKVKF